jgi:hypothetical protein
MSIVTVFRFQKYDIVSNRMKTSRHMATRETIRALDRELEVIEGTGVEIDSARLDGNGMIVTESASS